jgi:long-chain acyl-CoA synthetase
MSGYWRDDDRPIIDADGWVRTGDLGYLDGDGYLYVTGRAKDVIIRGGENVAAPRVEVAILAHPDVRSAAVVGLPDDDLGEVVAAAVVLERGARLEPDELGRFLRGHLAGFEVPDRWWFTDGPLPANNVGKIDKAALRRVWPQS